MNAPRDRRRADALEQALEAYDGMLAAGSDPMQAAERIGAGLEPGLAGVFAVAAGLRQAGERAVATASIAGATPDPAFAQALAERIRTSSNVQSLTLARQRRPRAPRRLATLTIAAAIAVVAGLAVPAFNSLPGDRLYGMKSLSEDLRVAVASGDAEARIRLDLAEERFSEVEGLIERAAISALGAAGGGISAAPLPRPGDINDPRLGSLIEATLREAGTHLEAAADILTKEHTGQPQDLDELVEVSRRGHKLATRVAEDLPDRAQPPVLNTVVKLAKIEAAAKAARSKATVSVNLPPCATAVPSGPTPDPTVTPEATAEPETSSDTFTPPPTEPPTPGPNDVPEPTATPVSTPCLSPEPTVEPNPTTDPGVEPSTEPTLTPGVQEDETTADGENGSDDASNEQDSSDEAAGGSGGPATDSGGEADPSLA